MKMDAMARLLRHTVRFKVSPARSSEKIEHRERPLGHRRIRRFAWSRQREKNSIPLAPIFHEQYGASSSSRSVGSAFSCRPSGASPSTPAALKVMKFQSKLRQSAPSHSDSVQLRRVACFFVKTASSASRPGERAKKRPQTKDAMTKRRPVQGYCAVHPDFSTTAHYSPVCLLTKSEKK